MKFTTTKNKTWRQGIGEIPKPWIHDTETEHEDSIREYFWKNIKCWDWDFAFDEEHDFVFDDGRAFRLYYSGWAEWYHENDDDNGIKDEWWIEEIKLEDAKVPEKNPGRDWI
jgi:hypothetical protein